MALNDRMTTVIQTNGLSKRYGRGTLALDKLTLSVQRGEIFGYLGPNGAGKTTTIRLLLDLIRPTEGNAQVLGMDVRRDSLAIRKRVGYLPGELALWDNLTALQTIRHFGELRGGLEMRYVHELAERLQFDLSKKVRTYSTGNKRKLGLILALMHKPELLILDEPTGGLDPLMQQEFYALMQEVRAQGRTVFLSSHILSEVQAICDRVGILRGGQLKAVQRVSELTRADFRHVTLRLREPVEAAVFAEIPGVLNVSADGPTVTMQLRGEFDPLLRALAPYYVVDMQVTEPTLEEIFLTFYEGDTMSLNGGQTAAINNRKKEKMQ